MKKILCVLLGVIAAVVAGFVVVISWELRPREIDIPHLVSGKMYVDGADGKSELTPLTPVQLQEADLWLEHHRKGWAPLLYTPAGPTKALYLKDSDGHKNTMDFYFHHADEKDSNQEIIWSIILTHNNSSEINVQSFPEQELKPFIDDEILK